MPLDSKNVLVDLRQLLFAFLLVSTIFSAGCDRADPPTTQAPPPSAQLTLSDVDGHDLAWPPGDEADAPTVLLFISRSCPIANGYAPEIGRLAVHYDAQGVRFWLVYPEPGVTADQVRAHAADYALPGTLVPDPTQALAHAVDATITPEAVVVLPGGAVAYRGRINDRYADLGVRRTNVRSHDLRDALDAILAGEAPPNARTTPIGCYIEAPVPEAPATAAP